MFCKQCGKKVAPGIPRCPHCGRSADVLSGGTGFWDLTTPPAAPAPVTVEIPTPTPMPAQIPETPVIPQPVPQPPVPPPVVEQEPRRPRKNPLKPFVLLLGLVVLILVIALAITAVRAGRLSNQLEEANLALAAQEAEEAQPEPDEAPAPSPVITPNPSQEPTPEPSPSEEPEPSPSPSPSEEPAPTEEPAEAQPAVGGNVAENPLLPLQLEFSEDMNGLTLSVDPGDLKVEEYQWIIVYDEKLETVEDCLEVLAETQLQEDPAAVKSMKDQVDPYDSSSGTETQELDLTVFYPDHTAFTKRVFCKMTMEDGSVQCSQLVSPGPEAAKDYVVTRVRKDILTAEVDLPEDMETENISLSYLALEPMEEVATADMQPYEEDFRMEIPMTTGGTYYVILATGDAVYPITGAITPET